ncbi:hypothetical protein PIB30_030646, partial [Stylosanthes scabra]|nr:hypothetical protein [Stylosanthes scabra]
RREQTIASLLEKKKTLSPREETTALSPKKKNTLLLREKNEPCEKRKESVADSPREDEEKYVAESEGEEKFVVFVGGTGADSGGVTSQGLVT